MADNSENVSAGSSAAPVGGASGGTHRSHNRVWVNPNYKARPSTKESAMSDADVIARMGLVSSANAAQTPTPPPNQFGKRPKGPTPAGKPAEKKRKKGKGLRIATSAQQRLLHSRALQNEGAVDNPIEMDDDNASVAQTEDDEDEGRNRKRAKNPALAKLMGGSNPRLTGWRGRPTRRSPGG